MLLLKRIFKFQKKKKRSFLQLRKENQYYHTQCKYLILANICELRGKRGRWRRIFLKKTASRNAVNCNISTQSIPLDRNDDDDDDAKHWLKLHLLLERISTLKHKINGILEYFFKISDKFVAYFWPFTFKSTLIIKWRDTKNIRNFTCFSM